LADDQTTQEEVRDNFWVFPVKAADFPKKGRVSLNRSVKNKVPRGTGKAVCEWRSVFHVEHYVTVQA